MSELPDEVRAAIHKKTMSQPLVEGVLRYLHDRHLILFASELRDEAVIERAARAIHRDLYDGRWDAVMPRELRDATEQLRDALREHARAALSAVLDAEER